MQILIANAFIGRRGDGWREQQEFDRHMRPDFRTGLRAIQTLMYYNK